MSFKASTRCSIVGVVDYRTGELFAKLVRASSAT